MTKRAAATTVAALTVLAAVVRLPGLNSGLWFDEIVTLVESVRLPLHRIVTAFPGNNNHPFYSLLAHVSIVAFGDHVWSLRLPAFVFGVAGIPLVYRLGLVVTTRIEALLASSLLALSYHDVWFSQNARGYTALLFFTLLATVLLVRLLRSPDRTLAIAYATAVALGIYTHLTMVFVAAAHAAVWAWQVHQERLALRRSHHVRTAVLALGVAGLLSAVLYVPMAWQVYAVFSAPRQAAAAVATPRWAALEMLRGLRIGFGAVGVLAAAALAATGAVSYFRRRPIVALLFTLPGVTTGIVMLALGAPIRPRFFLYLLGFGLLMLVRGAMEWGRVVERAVFHNRRTGAAGIVFVILIAMASAASLPENYRYPKQDFDGALRLIESRQTVSEPVATAGLAIFPYAQYYRTSWTAIDTAQQLASMRRGAPRTWVVYSFPEYMDPALVRTLQTDCTPQQVFHGSLGGGDVIVCTY